jgi:hypothetical protein
MPLSTILDDGQDHRVKLLHPHLTEHGLREPTEEADLMGASLGNRDIAGVGNGRRGISDYRNPEGEDLPELDQR